MLSVMMLLVLGCGGRDQQPRAPEADGAVAARPSSDRGRVQDPTGLEPLRIAAASDLQAVLPGLADRFQARTGLATSLIFGASGQLAQQIKAGAPFDVFLAANRAFVRDLVDAGLIGADSAHPYARGSLVLAVYRGLGADVRTLKDLAQPAVRKVALANPAFAPYGKAAKQALERAGMWEELKPKIVISETVRQALVYAQRGDADAALIGRAISAVPEIQAFEIDSKLYDPIIQELGIVAASKRTQDARRFTDFVVGEDGQGFLKEFGFAPPEL
jgi:molybdate transport system substrate-binding protein